MNREKQLLDRYLENTEGIYAFYPFDNMDKIKNENWGVFKIGMSYSSIDNRVRSYHTDLPAGIYQKCLLKKPTLKKRNDDLRVYYTRIERAIFQHLIELGATPIKLQIRRNNNGITEWIYASEKMIDTAFEYAHKVYGGKLSIIDHLNLVLKSTETKKKKNALFKGEIYFNEWT